MGHMLPQGQTSKKTTCLTAEPGALMGLEEGQEGRPRVAVLPSTLLQGWWTRVGADLLS